MSPSQQNFKIKLWLTQFLGDPIETKGKLLDLDDEVVGERGKAGGSVKHKTLTSKKINLTHEPIEM